MPHDSGSPLTGHRGAPTIDLVLPLRAHSLGLGLFVLACGAREPLGDGSQTASDASGPATLTESTGSSSTTDLPVTTTATATTSSTGSTTIECTTFDPLDCGQAVLTIPIVAPDIVLVLDKSGAMDSDAKRWDHDGDDANDDGVSDLDPNQPATPKVTRWWSLYQAVQSTLETFDGSINAGLSLFPSTDAISDYSAAACPVNTMIEVPIAPQNGLTILVAMPPAQATNLVGAVPGAAAIAAATAEHLALDHDAPRRIIYVTTGAANCHASGVTPAELFETYDPDLALRVSEALAEGIVTHVVGIAIEDATTPVAKDGTPDATNNHDRLNELADLGGAPLPGAQRFHAVGDEAALTAALTAIVRAELSCVVTLDPTPHYPESVEVEVNGINYGKQQVRDCASEDGWHFVDASTIELCGAACRDFQEIGSLDALYRCPPDPSPCF